MNNLDKSAFLIEADFNTLQSGVYMLSSQFKYTNGSCEFDQYLKGRNIAMQFYTTPLSNTVIFKDIENMQNNVTFIRHVTQWKGTEVIDASDWYIKPRQAVYETSKEDQTIQLLTDIRDLLQVIRDERT